MKRGFVSLLIGCLILLSVPSFAQSPSAAKMVTPSQAALAAWNVIGRKIIAMAEDFPEDKYDFKPHPTQRSFAEQLLHVAGSNDYFTDIAQGKKPIDDESRAHHKTKADIVAYLKKSFAEGATQIQKEGDAGMNRPVVEGEGGRTVPLSDLAYGLVEHGGEHYGQLVVYYRVAGMVPPESRPKK
ncbi:MAG TPA: DinB family protein [Terriglobales bacterium]|nr:DinB family protein [Terriglobales bacterium]